MMDRLRIVVLADDRANRKGLVGEHGLALFIEAGENKILFDTGQGLVLARNAEFTNVSLEAVTDIVLSHGHYDHTGGMAIALDKAPDARVWYHPQALDAKWEVGNGRTPQEIGTPLVSLRSLHAHQGVRSPVDGMTPIAPGIWLTGEIPRNNDFEKPPDDCFHDSLGKTPDLLHDDLALAMETPKGIVVVTGCAHSGIINTLSHVQQQKPEANIHAVIGGFHLLEAETNRIEMTIQAFQQMGLQRFFPGHCTGLRALAMLEQKFPGQCFSVSSGDRITI